jgi:hypothetical protein
MVVVVTAAAIVVVVVAVVVVVVVVLAAVIVIVSPDSKWPACNMHQRLTISKALYLHDSPIICQVRP